MLPEPEHVDIGHLRIAYRAHGAGAPVILLHGFFGDARVWRGQFELADEYRVIAWDAPGCGGSSRPPHTFRIADYADLLARFIRALDVAAPHLVGNSFGGALALALEARHPGTARSLVLVGAYAGWSGSFPPEVVATRLAKSLPDLDLRRDEVARKWLPGFVTPSAPQPLVDELAAIISDFDPDGMRSMILALAEADLRTALPMISPPTLLLWGEQDQRSSLEVAKDLAAGISGSKLVVLPGASHLTQMEAASRFNTELRSFLRRVSHSQTAQEPTTRH